MRLVFPGIKNLGPENQANEIKNPMRAKASKWQLAGIGQYSVATWYVLTYPLRRLLAVRIKIEVFIGNFFVSAIGANRLDGDIDLIPEFGVLLAQGSAGADGK